MTRNVGMHRKMFFFNRRFVQFWKSSKFFESFELCWGCKFSAYSKASEFIIIKRWISESECRSYDTRVASLLRIKVFIHQLLSPRLTNTHPYSIPQKRSTPVQRWKDKALAVERELRDWYQGVREDVLRNSRYKAYASFQSMIRKEEMSVEATTRYRRFTPFRFSRRSVARSERLLQRIHPGYCSPHIGKFH